MTNTGITGTRWYKKALAAIESRSTPVRKGSDEQERLVHLCFSGFSPVSAAQVIIAARDAA